jgi:flagellar basal body P-ring formation protein FlgA
MRAAIATAALLLAAVPALAQAPRPSLRADVTVSRDVVLLGDLVANAGPTASTPVFRAPALGRAGTIQATRILDAARAAGVSVEAGDLTQVVVSRASRRIAKTEIEIAVRKALANRYAVDNADVMLSLEGNENVVHVEYDATEELKVTDLVYEPRSRRVEAVVIVPGSRTLTLKPLRLAGLVVETVEVPIVTRSMSRGDPLREGDVRVERRPRAEFQALGFADASQLSGRVAKTNLAAGAVLRDSDVTRQDLVDKNGVVTVVYEIPGVALSMRGKALEAGGLGDVVQVQNPQSKRVLQGTVTGPGTISVTGVLPGRVADARSAVTR